MSLTSEKLARRPEQFGQVTRHRNVAHNRPVVAGTRIQVASIKAFNDEGYTVEQIIEEYPSLTSKDVEAVLHTS